MEIGIFFLDIFYYHHLLSVERNSLYYSVGTRQTYNSKAANGKLKSVTFNVLVSLKGSCWMNAYC